MGWAVITHNDTVLSVSLSTDNLLITNGTKIVELDDNICTDILIGKIPLSWALGKPVQPIMPTQHDISTHVTCSGVAVDTNKWMNLLFPNVNYNYLKNRHFFIWDWRLPTGLGGHAIPDAFPWTEFNDCRDLHINDHRMSIIIDNCMEAPDYHNHLKPLCDTLNTIDVQNRDIMFWATIDEPDNIPIKSINTNNGIFIGSKYYLIEPSFKTDTHFIMLARHPRPLRLIMANEILKRKLDKFGNISCGSWQRTHNYKYSIYIDEEFKSQFPMMLDGEIPDSSIKLVLVNDARITNAAINVICETSQDSILEQPVLWTMPFITEKSGKAFALCQFPLIVSVPSTVDKLRKLGFDLFDDIIDHSYDNELDPYTRIKMVCDQLEKMCDIENIDLFRQTYWSRLIDNRKHLIDLFKNTTSSNLIQLEQWLKDTQ